MAGILSDIQQICNIVLYLKDTYQRIEGNKGRCTVLIQRCCEAEAWILRLDPDHSDSTVIGAVNQLAATVGKCKKYIDKYGLKGWERQLSNTVFSKSVESEYMELNDQLTLATTSLHFEISVQTYDFEKASSEDNKAILIMVQELNSRMSDGQSDILSGLSEIRSALDEVRQQIGINQAPSPSASSAYSGMVTPIERKPATVLSDEPTSPPLSALTQQLLHFKESKAMPQVCESEVIAMMNSGYPRNVAEQLVKQNRTKVSPHGSEFSPQTSGSNRSQQSWHQTQRPGSYSGPPSMFDVHSTQGFESSYSDGMFMSRSLPDNRTSSIYHQESPTSRLPPRTPDVRSRSSGVPPRPHSTYSVWPTTSPHESSRLDSQYGTPPIPIPRSSPSIMESGFSGDGSHNGRRRSSESERDEYGELDAKFRWEVDLDRVSQRRSPLYGQAQSPVVSLPGPSLSSHCVRRPWEEIIRRNSVKQMLQRTGSITVPPSNDSRMQSRSSGINADDEALRIGLLISEQDAEFGTNMYETITVQDEPEILRLVNMGYTTDDAVYLIFQRTYRSRNPNAYVPIPLDGCDDHQIIYNQHNREYNNSHSGRNSPVAMNGGASSGGRRLSGSGSGSGSGRDWSDRIH